MTKLTVTPPLCLSVENTVSQRRKARFVVTLLVCLFAVPMRLPAPISEINTPTPAVKATEAPRRKIVFAGTWKGRTSVRCNDGTSDEGRMRIVVSADERMVAEYPNDAKSAVSLSAKRTGDTLNWSLRGPSGEFNYSLKLSGASSATYSETGRVPGAGTCRRSGTLTK